MSELHGEGECLDDGQCAHWPGCVRIRLVCWLGHCNLVLMQTWRDREASLGPTSCHYGLTMHADAMARLSTGSLT